MDFHHLISVQGGQFTLMLRAPGVSLTLGAQILMELTKTRFPGGFHLPCSIPLELCAGGLLPLSQLGQRLTELPELGGNWAALLISQLKMFLDISSPWNSVCQESSSPL